MFKDDEEDVSVFAFYVNIMPEESNEEDGSPLNLDHLMEPHRRIGEDEEPDVFEDECYYGEHHGGYPCGD